MAADNWSILFGHQSVDFIYRYILCGSLFSTRLVTSQLTSHKNSPCGTQLGALEGCSMAHGVSYRTRGSNSSDTVRFVSAFNLEHYLHLLSLCLGPSPLCPVRSIDRSRACRYPSSRDAERSGPRQKLHALLTQGVRWPRVKHTGCSI